MAEEILPLYCPIPNWDTDHWIYTKYVENDKIFSMCLTPKYYKRTFGVILNLYEHMIDNGYNVTLKNVHALEMFVDGHPMTAYQYFVGCCMNKEHADEVIKWIVGPLRELMNEKGYEQTNQLCFHAPDLYSLVEKVIEKKITPTMGKEILRMMGDGSALDDCLKMEKFIVAESSDLDKWIDESIAANTAAVEKAKTGDQKMINWLVGTVMKASKGKANAALVKESLLGKLNQS